MKARIRHHKRKLFQQSYVYNVIIIVKIIVPYSHEHALKDYDYLCVITQSESYANEKMCQFHLPILKM